MSRKLLKETCAKMFSWQMLLAATSADATVFRLLKAAYELFQADRLGVALDKLEYAQRCVPSHHGIMLLLGYARLGMGIATATEPLELLLRSSSNRYARYGLAAARLQDDDVMAAAGEINEALSHHSPPLGAWDQGLVARIVDVTDVAGWCSLKPDGRLLIGGHAALAPSRCLSAVVDGAVVAIALDAPRRHRGMRHPIRSAYLEGNWSSARRLDVTVNDVPLLGSPVDLRSVMSVSGFVSAEDGVVAGWCWHPGAEDFPVRLTLEDAASGLSIGEIEAAEPLIDAANFGPLDHPRQFQVPLDTLPVNVELLRVVGPGRANLYGSPVDPFGERQSAVAAVDAVALRYPSTPSFLQPAIPRQPSVGATVRGPKPFIDVGSQRPPVDVVIPVYRGRDVTLKAIGNVLEHDEGLGRIIVVSDASPDTALLRDLDTLSSDGRILLHKEQRNRGFPGAANVGMRLSINSDVVLLNSDAYVTPHWLSRLQEIAYSASDIGTVTPISNDATVFSYPQADQENPLLDDDELINTSEAAWAANAGACADVPSAHGFCMFIRRRCLDDVGLLREDVFGQGYGEENDFSVRAWNKGWRNVVTPGVYVAHVGGQSFASARVHLVKRNLRIMNRLHPGYDHSVQEWLRADPLAPARRRLDIQILQHWRSPKARLMLFLTHNRGGGIARHVRERMVEVSLIGMQAALIRPGKKKDTIEIRFGIEEVGCNLCYDLPSEMPGFTNVFAILAPFRIEIHHTMDVHPAVMHHLLASEIPYSVVLHDFHWYCPRITLTRGKSYYCGEPPAAFCQQCIRAEGSEFAGPIDPVGLEAASRDLLSNAATVTAPSYDTAQRIGQRLQVSVSVRPWERDGDFVPGLAARVAHDGIVRVCIVGAIGWEKGYGILLELAQIVAFEQMPIRLRVVGFTCDDDRLGSFDCVNITGRYEEAELISMIEREEAHIGLLPAIWPETWSYVLTAMWKAHLPVAAFDIGAPAERIRKIGGHLFPLGTSPRELAYKLIALGSKQKNTA